MKARDRDRRPTTDDLRAFLAALADEGTRKVFFFEFDQAFAEGPDSSRPTIDPELPFLLARLARLTDGGVAVLSGRSVAAVDRVLGPPHLPVVGQHGFEIRLPGGTTIGRRGIEELAPVRRRLAAAEPLPPGVVVDDAGRVIALRFDEAPDLGDVVDRLIVDLLATMPGELRVRRDRTTAEITFADASTPRALALAMASPTFAGRRPIVFAGGPSEPELVDVVHRFGGRHVHLGPGDRRGSDLALGGATDVLWLIRDLLAAHAERHAISSDRPAPVMRLETRFTTGRRRPGRFHSAREVTP